MVQPLMVAMLGMGLVGVSGAEVKVGDAAVGTHAYEEFERPAVCATCHVDIARQHEQAMMSQAYTHAWDEIEYFKLALPHAAKEPKVAGIKAGCNGCHAPLALLAGDVPPQPPAAGTRANEAVSCEVCHTIERFVGDTPFNFNYLVKPGKTKQGPRATGSSPYHLLAKNDFLRSAEFCGQCHNEKDPWGLWVKATQLEWKEGPHGKAGIVCQDCHMPPAAGKSAAMGKAHPDVRQHLFHGAHDPGKLAGVIEVRIHPDQREIEPGDMVQFTAVVVNAKAGHKVPSGSAEERVLWLDVEVTDSAEQKHHLVVTPKGFAGEEYTIASDVLAYQDMGFMLDKPDFAGLRRDGDVPAGDRIFRLPYLDPQGRMTIAQWNTASFGPDYRLAPLSAVSETYSWTAGDDLPEGQVTATARIYYSRLVSSVAQYMGVPEDEYAPVLVNSHSTTLRVVD